MIFIDKNKMKLDEKQAEMLSFHHLEWNEAPIISNGKPPYGYTGDCSMWRLIAKLSPRPTPCWSVTKRDEMSYSKDLTSQMSLLSGVKWTISTSFFFYSCIFFSELHQIFLWGKNGALSFVRLDCSRMENALLKHTLNVGHTLCPCGCTVCVKDGALNV